MMVRLKWTTEEQGNESQSALLKHEYAGSGKLIVAKKLTWAGSKYLVADINITRVLLITPLGTHKD